MMHMMSDIHGDKYIIDFIKKQLNKLKILIFIPILITYTLKCH